MDNQTLLYIIPVSGVLALLYAFLTTSWVGKQDPGTERMQLIAKQIQRGAMAFLSAEYKVLAIFVVLCAIVLGVTAQSESSSPLLALSFVVGASCSGLAGFFGMKVATLANVRTAAAARTGLSPALAVAFRGGAVMGMSVVGLAILGIGILFVFYLGNFGVDLATLPKGGSAEMNRTINVLAGFSMGASSIALFARVGGGIYTKAADVGADLVGKVEAGIPEDHFLNPATIADNVGDNVGDVAGMGADLFESYAGALIATMILGAVAVDGGVQATILPLCIAAAGIIVSISMTFFVRTKEGGNPQHSLDGGSFGAAAIMVPVSYFIIDHFVTSAQAAGHPITFDMGSGPVEMTTMQLLGSIVAGVIAGTAIGLVTGGLGLLRAKRLVVA